MGLFSNISKNGSVDQLKALEKLGKAGLNAKTAKLGTSYDSSVFEGNLSNFKDSALGSIMGDKELQSLFQILDADGDGNLSENEVGLLANAGKDGEKGKIDDADIKSLISSANKANKNSNVKENKKTGEKTETVKIDDNTDRIIKTDKEGNIISSEIVKKGKNGKVESKEISYPDGSKKELTYNKDGKVEKSVKTDAKGQTNETTYEYKDGKKVGAHSTIKRTDEDGNEYVCKKQDYQYKDGKKIGMTETDADGKELSKTTYEYDSKTGKLLQAQKVNTDGTVETTHYDKDGNKSDRVVVGANGKVESKTDYDKDGNKIGKTKYEYDENGKRTASYMYKYKNGEVSGRTQYDADGKLVSESTYETHTLDDGTRLVYRKDVDPDTKEVTGNRRLDYNQYNQLTGVQYQDKDGKVLYTIANNYNDAGKLTSQDKITYETLANGTEVTRRDKGIDGSVDVVTYYNDKTKVYSVDNNNDNKIDENFKGDYDASGNYKGQFVDLDGDGKYEKYQVWNSEKKKYEAMNDITT